MLPVLCWSTWLTQQVAVKLLTMSEGLYGITLCHSMLLLSMPLVIDHAFSTNKLLVCGIGVSEIELC